MPDVIYSKQFKKDFKKIPRDICLLFDERFSVFLEHPRHPMLNNHILHGEYGGCFSINIGGDYRAILKYEDGNIVKVVRIGTHSQLYK